MPSPEKSSEGGKSAAAGGNTRQARLEMAERIARDTLRDDHHAFEVSIRNSRG